MELREGWKVFGVFLMGDGRNMGGDQERMGRTIWE